MSTIINQVLLNKYHLNNKDIYIEQIYYKNFKLYDLAEIQQRPCYISSVIDFSDEKYKLYQNRPYLDYVNTVYIMYITDFEERMIEVEKNNSEYIVNIQNGIPDYTNKDIYLNDDYNIFYKITMNQQYGNYNYYIVSLTKNIQTLDGQPLRITGLHFENNNGSNIQNLL